MRYLALFLVGVLLATPVFAQSANRIIIQGSNGNLAEVNSSGELEVTGGGGGGGDVNIEEVGGTATVTGGISGLIGVGGNAASGATDSGNPVKVGGAYNSTRPTFTNGQRSDLQSDTRGNIGISIFGPNTDTGAGVSTSASDDLVTSANGLLVRSLEYVFDGTTWDRLRGDSSNGVLVNLGANNDITIADGADVAEGALADAACATDNGTCSVIALIKRANQRLTSLIASLGGTGTVASAVPATAVYGAYGSDGGLSAGTAALTAPIICQNSVAISTASSGNVELVALTSGETVYVCEWNVIATGTVAVQLVYGTGTACATSETNLTGAYPLVANAGLVDRSDFAMMRTASGNALCIELSGAVQVDGVLYYTKF